MIFKWMPLSIATIFLLTGCGSGESATPPPPVVLPPVVNEVNVSLGEDLRTSENSSVMVNVNIEGTSVNSGSLAQVSGIGVKVEKISATQFEISIPLVEKAETLEFEYSLSIEGQLHSDKIAINIQNTLPNPLQSEEVNSAIGVELVSLFDNYLETVTKTPYYLDGLIVSNRETAAHQLTLNKNNYDVDSGSINNLPADKTWQIASSTIYGHTVLIDEQSNVYLIDGDNFDTAISKPLRQATDGLSSVVLWDISADSLTFKYVYLHNNTNFINSLVRAYESTSNHNYLTQARSTAEAVIALLDENFKYKRQFLYEEQPLYTGMDQGIVLDSLFRVSQHLMDEDFHAAVIKIAESYSHSTEGVWNHWANSIIGAIARDNVLGLSSDETTTEIVEKMPLILSEVHRLDGEIPYYMTINHPKYDSRTATYHTYDAMLLSKISTLVPEDLQIASAMDEIINAISVNYSSYYANNVETIANMYLSSSYVNQDFAQTLARVIDVEHQDLIVNISLMRATAAFIQLHEHSTHPEITYNFRQRLSL